MNEIKENNTTSSYSKKFIQEALEDFKIACISREASILGRKEVLTGKAKFGIFGAGKELAQLAMARVFKKGDFRSGYYRGQTFMLAKKLATVEQLFAQLYAHADQEYEPFSSGRQMNAHFATALIDSDGQWTKHKKLYNVSADISPTAGQMARALGIALASKKYRDSEQLSGSTDFSDKGNEISFCCIGDASTSEGVFWETMNAAAVMQVPLAVFVWDDGYGISVPKKYQTVKGSISEALSGFDPDSGSNGLRIYKVKGWDYVEMRKVFEKALKEVRNTHQPCLFHVEEITQPQGHSTSGSHERYKSAERLQFEKDMDGILKMKEWLAETGILSLDDAEEIHKEAKKEVRASIKSAWAAFNVDIKKNIQELNEILNNIIDHFPDHPIVQIREKLNNALDPTHKDYIKMGRRALIALKGKQHASIETLKNWLNDQIAIQFVNYNSNLYSESDASALKVEAIPAKYAADAPTVNGYEVLNKCFDAHFAKNPYLYAFGEDVGFIGDVNQGFAGLQAKFGENRIFDTGIREWTIMGQAIGMSMRGLRPIAEIQYLDYLIYSLSALSDDLATLRYRSNALQQAPAIIRTRGHRLEGIWHSGSPIGMLLNSLKGICLLVPRNMTQAAGFYNTMLQSDDPALIIECLNGYRLKELLPDNIDSFRVPVGVPEVLREGADVTLVTYGSCVRIAESAVEMLAKDNVHVELIDVQSLMPFDIHHMIKASVQKTNRLVILDEDFQGGASAYMLNELLNKQACYFHLDAQPLTICAEDVRSPYGSDGDYVTKPNVEDVYERIYALMHESSPQDFPAI